MSFIGNQAKLRSIDKLLDRRTTRAAMNSKITDAKSVLAVCIKNKNAITKRYLGETKNRRFKLRKLLKKIRNEIEPSVIKIRSKNEKKTRHLEQAFHQLEEKMKQQKDWRVQKQTFSPTKVPERLQEYKDLPIFGTASALILLRKLGTAVTHHNMMLLLSRSLLDFRVELMI